MTGNEAVRRGVGQNPAHAKPSARRPRVERIEIQEHGVAGMIWFGSWLFTIGYLDLSFWKSVLALLAWPFYLGANLGAS